MNHFILGRDTGYPALTIMVNGNLAWLYFHISDDHVGWYSVGSIPELDPKGMTEFVFMGPQQEWRYNDQLIPIADAMRAAKEFSVTGQMPQCIDWREPEPL